MIECKIEAKAFIHKERSSLKYFKRRNAAERNAEMDFRIVGVDCDEGPPVPIPNTEVKLICADDTCRVTDWENT